MRSRALVALPKGAREVSTAVRSAQAEAPLGIVVEPVEVDPTSRFDPDGASWRAAQFITFSDDLRHDPALQPFILSVEDEFLRLDLPGAWPWYMLPPPDREPARWPWLFTCNVCGTQNRILGELPGREEPSCTKCRSTVRYRATVRALVQALLGENIALPSVSPRKDITGLGISDWQVYAKRLASLFAYTNTYLDSEPSVDLTEAPREDFMSAFDFAVAGDVFEHVAPPVEAAMMNLRRILRPHGVAVLTVPFTKWPKHVEHFPELFHWALEEADGHAVLVNERADGIVERFTSLCFHGPGHSLEMRVFTEASFLEALESAGFVDVCFSNEPGARYGILLPDWPGPVVARAP